MAELLIRASSQDAKLLRRVFGFEGSLAAPAHPDRIVVDAHVPSTAGGIDICATARRAGIPFLIDPQTYLLQDAQHPGDSWAALPFGDPARWSALGMDAAVQEELVGRVVDYQIANGATSIIPPYVHLQKSDSEWIQVQTGLWEQTRRYLDREGITLQVTAVVSVGWRVLQNPRGFAALGPTMAALATLQPREVALAASKVDQGVHPEDRLTDLVSTVERLTRNYPVILWQQGHLGEVGVAAGAAGYECGIGWRERCDITAASTTHRSASASGLRSARPVFVPILGRSIPKRSLEGIRSQHREMWLRMLCHDNDCCPAGGQALLNDARSHAIIQRARHLDQIARIDRSVWRWQHLADLADAGLVVAERINRYSPTSLTINEIDTRALRAISAVGHIRRHGVGDQLGRVASADPSHNRRLGSSG